MNVTRIADPASYLASVKESLGLTPTQEKPSHLLWLEGEGVRHFASLESDEEGDVLLHLFSRGETNPTIYDNWCILLRESVSTLAVVQAIRQYVVEGMSVKDATAGIYTKREIQGYEKWFENFKLAAPIPDSEEQAGVDGVLWTWNLPDGPLTFTDVDGDNGFLFEMARPGQLPLRIAVEDWHSWRAIGQNIKDMLYWSATGCRYADFEKLGLLGAFHSPFSNPEDPNNLSGQ